MGVIILNELKGSKLSKETQKVVNSIGSNIPIDLLFCQTQTLNSWNFLIDEIPNEVNKYNLCDYDFSCSDVYDRYSTFFQKDALIDIAKNLKEDDTLIIVGIEAALLFSAAYYTSKANIVVVENDLEKIELYKNKIYLLNKRINIFSSIKYETILRVSNIKTLEGYTFKTKFGSLDTLFLGEPTALKNNFFKFDNVVEPYFIVENVCEKKQEIQLSFKKVEIMESLNEDNMNLDKNVIIKDLKKNSVTFKFLSTENKDVFIETDNKKIYLFSIDFNQNMNLYYNYQYAQFIKINNTPVALKNNYGDTVEVENFLRGYAERGFKYKFKNNKTYIVCKNTQTVFNYEHGEYEVDLTFIEDTSVEEILDHFKKLEKEKKLYDYTIDNIYIWEVIRPGLLLKVIRNLGIWDPDSAKSNMINVETKTINLDEVSNQEIKTLFVNIGNDFTLNNQIVSKNNSLVHTYDNLTYLQYKMLGYDVNKVVYGIKKNEVNCIQLNKAKELAQLLKIELQLIPIQYEEILEEIIDRIKTFKSTYTLYDDFLKKNKVDEVVGISSSWCPGVISAVQDNNIKFTDVQYAMISKNHTIYNMEAKRMYAPDLFVTWNDFWKSKEIYCNNRITIAEYQEGRKWHT